jgi:hypothetical protein
MPAASFMAEDIDGAPTAAGSADNPVVDVLDNEARFAEIALTLGGSVFSHVAAFVLVIAALRSSSLEGAPVRYARTRRRKLSDVGGSAIFGRTTFTATAFLRGELWLDQVVVKGRPGLWPCEGRS